MEKQSQRKAGIVRVATIIWQVLNFVQNVEKQSQVKAGIVRVATIIWQGLNFVQNVEEQTNQYRSQRNGIVHADIII